MQALRIALPTSVVAGLLTFLYCNDPRLMYASGWQNVSNYSESGQNYQRRAEKRFWQTWISCEVRLSLYKMPGQERSDQLRSLS